MHLNRPDYAVYGVICVDLLAVCIRCCLTLYRMFQLTRLTKVNPSSTTVQRIGITYQVISSLL